MTLRQNVRDKVEQTRHGPVCFCKKKLCKHIIRCLKNKSVRTNETRRTNDTLCQVCQSPFDEERILLCDICNAGWLWPA